LDMGRHEHLWPEIDNDLDLAFAVLERLVPAFDRDGACDQPAKPILVRARERGRRHLVMPAIGIDRPEYDVVVKHYGAVEAADIHVEHLSGLGDAGQAHDPGRGRRLHTTPAAAVRRNQPRLGAGAPVRSIRRAGASRLRLAGSLW